MEQNETLAQRLRAMLDSTAHETDDGLSRPPSQDAPDHTSEAPVALDAPDDDEEAELPRQPDYASLVRLRRAIARKRAELVPLLQACEAYGLPALARESGFPTRTLRYLAGPKPKGPLPVPTVSQVALCIRELRRYRKMLDTRAEMLDTMRSTVRERRAQGTGWVRIERLLGANGAQATGAFAIQLLRTTNRRRQSSNQKPERQEQ